MPWKECQIVDERLRFIARLLDGEKMAGLCREFSIARKTGYKIYTRYKDCGLEGLTDRSRRPYRHANQLPVQIETLIVALKREYPRWGAPKIRARLRRRYPDLACPAISTVHAVLDRHGLVTRRKRRRYKAQGTPLSRPTTPNELWCADYKGEFMLTDRRYCYPLTISDFASRYLITCEALATTRETFAFSVFERAFKDFGLPRAIRTACYEQVVKALGAVGPSNRGTDTGSGSVEPAHRASSGLIPEERRVPGGSTSSCLRREGLRTTVGMASSPVGAGASGFYAAIDSSLHTWSASNAVRFLTTANA